MRKLLTVVMLSVFVLSSVLIMGPVAAQEDGVSVTPLGEAVTVRSGPGVEYSIRGTLMPGFDLPVTGRTDFDEEFACSGDPVEDNAAWLRVEVVEGIEGWVSFCTVEVTGEVLDMPVSAPAFPILQETVDGLAELTAEGWEPSDPFFGSVLVTPVLVYEYPTLGSPLLGKIEAGEVVELLAVADNGSWYQVQYGEVVGWVPSYLMVVGEDQEAELEVVNLEEFFAALIEEAVGEGGEGCDNPPPPWAPAWGWRRKCEGLGKGEYEPTLPPGQEGKAGEEAPVEETTTE